jgi:hypothetical protein
VGAYNDYCGAKKSLIDRSRRPSRTVPVVGYRVQYHQARTTGGQGRIGLGPSEKTIKKLPM